MALDLDTGRIEEAAKVIDPVFLNSPQYSDEQLNAHLGRDVLVKVETTNPLRSFKGRGADFLMRGLEGDRTVVCASAGNFGQAMAYAGRARGIPVEIFVSTEINPMKKARMAGFGARVFETGDDLLDTARAHAEAADDRIYVADGKEPAVAEGAGTIGLELLRSGPLDAVVVQIGDGALINGIGTWMKEHSPDTRIIGVCPAGAPAIERSWRTGQVVEIAPGTVADGLAIRRPFAESVRRMRELVDDIVFVTDEAITEAVGLAGETLGLILEPSGAAGLAALAVHNPPGDRVAIILTGSNAPV